MIRPLVLPFAPSVRAVLAALGLVVLCWGMSLGLARPGLAASSWQEVLDQARGDTVYFNAWGGDPRVNAYIAWVAQEVKQDYGITLRHVKVADIAETVARVLTEKTAGRHQDGSVDLMWLNGENFLAMKESALLEGPFVDRLPNAGLMNLDDRPVLSQDFTVPTEGLECPWGLAQLVFEYDSARLPDPPRSLEALTAWIVANPGRFTYPQPPDFTGSTFLKQVLHDLLPDPSVLARPATKATFEPVTAPLWGWLEKTRPFLWRDGRAFPPSAPTHRQLLGDGEVDIALSFQTGGASAAIAEGLLPDTVRTVTFDEGTIGNVHFLAIPYNARAKAAAMVVANFLISPRAQARKQDSRVWGDDTVLDLALLPAEHRAMFESLPRGIATLPPQARGPVLPEPHPSWMNRIEAEWRRRHMR